MAKVKLHGNYAEYEGRHWTSLEPAMPDNGVQMKTKCSYRMVKQCVSILTTILLAIFAAVWLPCKKAQTLCSF